MEIDIIKPEEDVIKRISNYISSASLMRPIELKPISDDIPYKHYIDTGSADIWTRRLDDHFIYEGKKILGFSSIDHYAYGREKQTFVKYTVTLYYDDTTGDQST